MLDWQGHEGDALLGVLGRQLSGVFLYWIGRLRQLFILTRPDRNTDSPDVSVAFTLHFFLYLV
jgi:hypothetical protein